MLFTRKGDTGTTALFGEGARRAKTDPVFEALGALDELCSWLGVCRAEAEHSPLHRAAHEGIEPLGVMLEALHQQLFIMQAELAGADKHLTQAHVRQLEARIAAVSHVIGPVQAFRVPGATRLSADLDYARALARRCERRVLALSDHDLKRLSPAYRAYANRLSSAFYALARLAAHQEGVHEAVPSY